MSYLTEKPSLWNRGPSPRIRSLVSVDALRLRNAAASLVFKSLLGMGEDMQAAPGIGAEVRGTVLQVKQKFSLVEMCKSARTNFRADYFPPIFRGRPARRLPVSSRMIDRTTSRLNLGSMPYTRATASRWLKALPGPRSSIFA
jgi:hypothetical protein